MLRLFLNIPIPAHAVLLLATILLRLPSLIGGYYTDEESLFMVCAQRIAEGGDLYSTAWYAGPPLIVWIYYVFWLVFGTYSLFAIRLFACLYVYFAAVYFNGMLIEYKPFKRFETLPAFIFVFWLSTPWFAQTFSPTLFIILPVLISFHTIIKIDDGKEHASRMLFNAGMLIALCMLASYKAVFIFVGIILTYLILKRPQPDHLASLIGGGFVIAGALILYLFLNGNFSDFLDVGVFYYLDRIRFGASELYNYQLTEVAITWLMSWGILIFLALSGYIHYRMKFYSYVVKIRSLESTMNMWLFVVTMTLFLKWRRLELQDFILLIPPAAFYTSKAFDFQWVYRLRFAILIVSLLLPTYIYFSYWGLKYPHGLDMLRPLSMDIYLHGGTWGDFDVQDPLVRYFDGKDAPNGIWVMDDSPSQYVKLGYHCANKYTDYRIVVNKLTAFPSFKPENIRSRPEEANQIFREFELHPPDYIIDPHKKFPYLQHRFPSLLHQYTKEEVGEYDIYRAKPKLKPAF